MSLEINSPDAYLQYFSSTNNFVQSAYTELLHRQGKQQEVKFWENQIENGLSYANVISYFTSSPEYQQNITTPKEFITSLYSDLLHRSPDSDGLQHWSQELIATSKEVVVKKILDSKEFQHSSSAQSDHDTDKPLLFASEGGGFRAMTTDAGLFAGLIKYFEDTRGSKIDISNFLSHADAISGNSGSSWFLSCLAYSEAFKSSLQDYKYFFDPNDNGYMGLVGQEYIKYIKGNINPSAKVPAEIVDFIDLLKIISNLNWADFVGQTVYAPHDTLKVFKDINFHSSLEHRTDALPTQPLIYQVALSTDRAGVAPYSFLGETTVTIANAGHDEMDHFYTFIPTSVTSLGEKSFQQASILPTISTQSLELLYEEITSISQNNYRSTYTKAPELNFNDLSVFTASSASSAALAFANSIEASHLPAEIVRTTQELATPVLVKKSSSGSIGSDYPDAAGKNYPIVGPESLESLKITPILRLGDGHYADGTSVTSGMSYFTPDQLKNGFNVTLFGNLGYTDLLKTGPIDLGVLSILGIVQDPKIQGIESGKIGSSTYVPNLNHPSNQVFELTNVSDINNWSPKPVWSYASSDSKFQVNYYEIGVKTSKNNSYTESGNQGTLKLWEVVSDTNLISDPTEIGWSGYSYLYEDIINALQTTSNGIVGAELLASSLGLI